VRLISGKLAILMMWPLSAANQFQLFLAFSRQPFAQQMRLSLRLQTTDQSLARRPLPDQ